MIVTGGHTEDGADVLFDGAGTLRIEGPRYPDGASHGSGCTHSSALAAFLARGDRARRRGALGARDRRRGGRQRPARARRAAPGPVDVARARPSAERARAAGIIRVVKLVRMKPGHGDVLLAEGDPEVAEDEERLIEEFRRQLDHGMWAAVPTADGGAPRGDHGPRLRRGPAATPSG